MADELPAEGQPAPDFTLASSEGGEISLHDLRGKNVILYFYVRDATPGCTQQACDFRDNLVRLRNANTEVLGVSDDDIASHEKFRDKHALPFPLLADTDHAVSEAYGVWQLKKQYGREYWGIVRTTFVIDPKGTLRKVFPRVRVKGHVDQVGAFIEEKMAAS
ncbi:MAG: thioredoxin-dependent thiol peroxidase [Thermoplasmata archaeon]